MTRVRVHALAIASLLIATGSLVACGSSSSQTSSGQTGATAGESITVATLPVVDNVVVWLGVKKGYFSQHGLNVKYDNLSGGGPAIVKALQSGSVQFGQFSAPVLIIAASHGVSIKSVAELDTFPKDKSPEGIFVKAGSPIQSVDQLKGATIGVNSTTSLEAVRLETEVLPAAHLTTSDVHLVPIPFAQMQEALSTGEVQAVLPFDPITTKLRQLADFRQLTNLSSYLPAGGLVLGVYAATSSYVSAHPKVVEDFRAAITQSIADIQATPQDAVDVASQVLGLPSAVVQPALQNIDFAPGGNQDLATYQNAVTALKSVNLVPDSFNISTALVQ